MLKRIKQLMHKHTYRLCQVDKEPKELYMKCTFTCSWCDKTVVQKFVSRKNGNRLPKVPRGVKNKEIKLVLAAWVTVLTAAMVFI